MNLRISTVPLRTNNIDVVLIDFQALMNKKDLFYIMLEDVFESMKGNIIPVLREFNAKIKRERYYRAIIGNHNLHMRNRMTMTLS